MQIGLDASGKFELLGGYEPSAMAAAVVPESAREEVALWTQDALKRWGRETLGELHMKDLD